MTKISFIKQRLALWLCRGVLLAILAVAGHDAVMAQVTNYSLRLTEGGSVKSGPVRELNNCESYTIQFWLNPTEWTEGAEIFSRGSFKATLTGSNGISFAVGSTAITAYSDNLAVDKWTQVTLVCDSGAATVYLNNVSDTTGMLSAIPEQEHNLVLGTNFVGRIDEFRLWKAALASTFARFYNNTLNKYAPQWDDLVVYYKFDQDQSDNVVDYKTVLTPSTPYSHHAQFSTTGAKREAVTDNAGLPYLLNGAYTANERFYDRVIEREKYLLANDLIILGIQSYSDGHLKYVTPNNHATITGGTRLDNYEGRSGVMKLDGSGKLTCGVDALNPVVSNGVATLGYTFETWIYLDEWTEGAYIFRKETDNKQNGFSIRLGSADSKQVIVRVNGKDFVNNSSLTTGKWIHFGVTTNDASSTATTFRFVYDKEESGVDTSASSGSIVYTPTGYDTCVAYVGENLKAKLDELTIWNMKYTAANIYSHGQTPWIPAVGKTLVSYNMQRANTMYLFDDAANPGFDTYSQDSWRNIMESAYKGYRGYQIRISVKSHNGWQTTISTEARRKIFAADLAKLVEGYAGAELDLEWAQNSTQWNNYNLLIQAIRDVFPADKTFMVSCHASYYSIGTSYMSMVDGFTFQQYGPSKDRFTYSDFKSGATKFAKYGYPAGKMYLSYSTTTSGAYNASDTKTSNTVVGVKDGFMDSDSYVPNAETDKGLHSNGNYYYFTGPLQAYERSKYVVENNYQGIFYWDMGNDTKIDHKYVLAKYSNYGLSANVDTLITEVQLPEFSSDFLIAADEAIDTIQAITGYVNGYTTAQRTAVEEALNTYKASPTEENRVALGTAIANVKANPIAFATGKYYRFVVAAPLARAAAQATGITRSYFLPDATTAKALANTDAAGKAKWGLTDSTSVFYMWKLDGSLTEGFTMTSPNHGTYYVDFNAQRTNASSTIKGAVVDSVYPATMHFGYTYSGGNWKLQAHGADKYSGSDADYDSWRGTGNPPTNHMYLQEVTHIHLNISSVGYATAHWPFAVKIPEGVKAYIAYDQDTEYIKLQEISGSIPANTGVIIEGEAGLYGFEITYDDVTAVSGNLLSGVNAPQIFAAGNYVFQVGPDDGIVGFYRADAAGTLAKNKAYVPAANIKTTAATTASLLQLQIQPTAIGSVNADASTGTTTIYYDLQGRKIANPKSGGIYVTSTGEKVILK